MILTYFDSNFMNHLSQSASFMHLEYRGLGSSQNLIKRRLTGVLFLDGRHQNNITVLKKTPCGCCDDGEHSKQPIYYL